jgi:PAS domain S-box-containing protein
MATSPDPNTTGAPTPLPAHLPGTAGRETHERAAAIARADAWVGHRVHPDVTFEPFAGLKAHRLFTALADNVRDYAVFLMDPNGIILYWGEGARLMKWWTPAQAEGSHLRLLYPDGGSEDGTAEDHLVKAAATGEYTGEGQRVRADGSTFWAGITLTALADERGTLLGFAKVTRDFSARRAMEAALKAGREAAEAQRVAEEANRLKTLFIASVSHEIRGPLNAMMGFLQMLTREGERQQAHIARVLSSGNHLIQVVDDVLDITQLESGRLVVKSMAAPLGGAVMAAVGDTQPQAQAKGVRLFNAVSGSAVETPYWGDELRVRQIIVQMLANGVKVTPSGGQVKISGGTVEQARNAALIGPGPWVYVRVEDGGEQMSLQQLEAIFEPFNEARLSEAYQGTELGFPISRRLARLMGGDLIARSNTFGSEFLLYLPVAASGPVPR